MCFKNIKRTAALRIKRKKQLKNYFWLSKQEAYDSTVYQLKKKIRMPFPLSLQTCDFNPSIPMWEWGTDHLLSVTFPPF